MEFFCREKEQPIFPVGIACCKSCYFLLFLLYLNVLVPREGGVDRPAVARPHRLGCQRLQRGSDGCAVIRRPVQG